MSDSRMDQNKKRREFMASQGMPKINRRKLNEALRDWDTTHPKPAVQEEYRPGSQRSSSGSSSAGVSRGFPYPGLFRPSPRIADDTKFLGYTEEEVVNARNDFFKKYCKYENNASGCVGGATYSCPIHPKYCNDSKGFPKGTWKDINLIEGLKLNCYLPNRY